MERQRSYFLLTEPVGLGSVPRQPWDLHPVRKRSGLRSLVQSGTLHSCLRMSQGLDLIIHADKVNFIKMLRTFLQLLNDLKERGKIDYYAKLSSK